MRHKNSPASKKPACILTFYSSGDGTEVNYKPLQPASPACTLARTIMQMMIATAEVGQIAKKQKAKVSAGRRK